ncbi:hypothetical protein [Brachyspira hyodysenteriae]|uniref:hypothetical protein n=1 Tax=Brachyspira hyodysenteriae TaxID=159 RepID=UPI00063DAF7A|nr:hypothetical protein [Brachyspira hyodysenteriae]KLI17764.1 hypothetical protein SU45_04270 [Brachyspira hyodysenteriae]KLI58505.1 hypothetical protein SZ46_10835 [Brachyspira hyodysenteriae]
MSFFEKLEKAAKATYKFLLKMQGRFDEINERREEYKERIIKDSNYYIKQYNNKPTEELKELYYNSEDNKAKQLAIKKILHDRDENI